MQVGDGDPLPSHLKAAYLEMDDQPDAADAATALPVAVFVTMQLAGDRLAVTRFELVGTADEPHVSAQTFRAVRFQEIVERIAGSAALSLGTYVAEDQRGAGKSAVGGRRRPVDAELLSQVAEIVKAHPDKPNQHVQDQLHASPRTASRWIAAARRAGYLNEGSDR